MALSYAEDFQKAGGSVFMGYEVDQFSSSGKEWGVVGVGNGAGELVDVCSSFW